MGSEPQAQRSAGGLWYLHAGPGDPATGTGAWAAADPVVFLHGWAAFKEIWWGTLRRISDRYSAVALEWPGHGASSPEPQPTLASLVHLTVRACTELGLERVTLVGHSMGGNVAAHVALAHPDLVARLVLVDAALDARHIAGYGRRFLDPAVLQGTVRSSRQLSSTLSRFRAGHDHRGGLVAPYLRRAHYNGLADDVALHGYLRSLYDTPLTDRLPQIGQPTLVITGALDPLVLPRQARLAAAAIPNARLAVIPASLHTPMDERPAAFARVLRRFLDDNAPGP
jgi:pimeloyl-ACP methyl ester carboxylesterase